MRWCETSLGSSLSRIPKTWQVNLTTHLRIKSVIILHIHATSYRNFNQFSQNHQRSLQQRQLLSPWSFLGIPWTLLFCPDINSISLQFSSLSLWVFYMVHDKTFSSCPNFFKRVLLQQFINSFWFQEYFTADSGTLLYSIPLAVTCPYKRLSFSVGLIGFPRVEKKESWKCTSFFSEKYRNS